MIYSSCGVYDILLSDENNRSYIKNVLALPSLIMQLKGYTFLEVHQSTSIHDKSAPHGSGGLIKAF